MDSRILILYATMYTIYGMPSQRPLRIYIPSYNIDPYTFIYYIVANIDPPSTLGGGVPGRIPCRAEARPTCYDGSASTSADIALAIVLLYCVYEYRII